MVHYHLRKFLMNDAMQDKLETRGYLPDIVELNLASDNISDLFQEVAGIICSSKKIVNSQSALREFQNFSREWNRNKKNMVDEGINFFRNGIFPFTINYCPFLEMSESLLFLGKTNKGLSTGINDTPPVRVICSMLFHSVESFEQKKQEDLERQKFNLYWNNLFTNKKFIEGFLELTSSDDLIMLIAETHNYLEKRRYPRYSIDTVAYCRTLLFDDDVAENKEKVRVRNISHQGILLEHSNPFPVNNAVEISLLLDDRILYMVGKVCRVDKLKEIESDKYYSGVNLTQISSENQLLISRYLQSCQ